MTTFVMIMATALMAGGAVVMSVSLDDATKGNRTALADYLLGVVVTVVGVLLFLLSTTPIAQCAREMVR